MRYTSIQCDISIAALENAMVHLSKDKVLTLVCTTERIKYARKTIDVVTSEHGTRIVAVGLDTLPRDVWFVTDGHEMVMCGDR